MILNRHFWTLLEHFSQERRCLWCHNKFENPWTSVVDGVVKINGAVAFHWQDSHGIDPETLEQMLSAHFFKDA